MDAQERKVIRWKRDLLASSIIMDDTTIKKLKAWDLIWDSVIKELQESEIKNDEKVWKYLEHLMRAKLEKNAFQSLCKFLDEENPWISSELREELVLERGQLKLDEYIKNEASTLIHRHFGGTKRFSEGDKKQFEDILAARNQCTKNIWMRNLEQTRQALSEQLAISEDRSKAIREMTYKMQTFLNSCDGSSAKDSQDNDGLQRSLSSMKWTNENAGPSLLVRLESSTDRLIEFARACQHNIEVLEEEKAKSMKLLGNFAKESGVELEGPDGIKKWLRKLKERQEEEKHELAAMESQLQQARSAMKSMEEGIQGELRERDQNIRFLASSLEKLQVDSDTNGQEKASLETNLSEASKKIIELEEKVKYWETFRRYGYWHGSNHENCKSCYRDSSLDRKLLHMRPRKDTPTKKHTAKGSKKAEKQLAKQEAA